MAPDYPYPQSINDCYAVTIYVVENCNQLGGDLNKLVIAGDSAGGNKTLIFLKNYQSIQTLLIFKK